jgi:hypothetical protein
VVVGDQNVVRQDFAGLFRMLDDFDNKIRLTNELTDDQKLEYLSDVKTIQDQLTKSNPDKGIISKSWGALKGIATLGSLMNVADRVRT